MNRRTFLKILAAAGIAPVMPQVGSLSSMYKKANAAIDYSAINIQPPFIMPQVINLFLYGGPSELAGNLSNIDTINQQSETRYTDFFSGILEQQGTGPGGRGSITPDGFWGSNAVPDRTDADSLGAGGDDMQFLVDRGHMSVYRTMMSRKNNSQSHRQNILMSQKGSLDIEFSAGVGNKLASLIFNNRALYEGNARVAGAGLITDVEQLLMPFVSILDGDTRVFDKGDSGSLPLLFNGISVKEDLSNPFSRNIDRFGNTVGTTTDPAEILLQEQESALLDALVEQTSNADPKDYTEVVEAFEQRVVLADAMAGFEGEYNTTTRSFPLPTMAGATDTPLDVAANGGVNTLEYPDSAIGRSVQAAVTLAVENPETLFITLGGALGGWDDHNNGVDSYPERMRDVFESLRVAMMHIKYSGTDFVSGAVTPIGGNPRPTKNIIINVFGDFGRRVNLNSSLGWDHGNNQNFYTLGGSRPGLRTPGGTDALGKVVGTTVHVGEAGENDQYTEPAAGSYEFEPISVAANIFKHFGVIYPAEVNMTTPDPLTAAFDPDNPSVMLDPGSPPIDETKT